MSRCSHYTHTHTQNPPKKTYKVSRCSHYKKRTRKVNGRLKMLESIKRGIWGSCRCHSWVSLLCWFCIQAVGAIVFVSCTSARFILFYIHYWVSTAAYTHFSQSDVRESIYCYGILKLHIPGYHWLLGVICNIVFHTLQVSKVTSVTLLSTPCTYQM